MDRKTSATEHSTAMPPDWGFALGLLLRAGAGDQRESRVDAVARRAVSAHSVLGRAEHDMVAGSAGLVSESQTREAPAESHGAGSHLRQAAIVDSGARSSHLSLFAQRRRHPSSRSLLGQRYY